MDARQTKLFLLLQTEQYEAALALIDLEGKETHHAYERAYTFYRLQNESEAREILKVIKEEKSDNDRAITHLEAQLVRLACVSDSRNPYQLLFS